MQLPGWVVDNRTAVARDVAPYTGIPPEDSWPLVVRAAQNARAQLAWDPNPAETLAFRDPLPQSTLLALRRLRAQHSERGG